MGVRPPYDMDDIVEYSTFPAPPVHITYVYLNALIQDTHRGTVGKSTLLRDYGKPTLRTANAEGDSVWEYKPYLFRVFFHGNDTTAKKIKSYNYHGSIYTRIYPEENKITYEMPGLWHFYVMKRWMDETYSYIVEVSIESNDFTEEDAGRGVHFFLANGKTLSFDDQPVGFGEINTLDSIAPTTTIWARIEATPEQVNALGTSPVKKIKLVNTEDTIPADEAEYLLAYMRLMVKIR